MNSLVNKRVAKLFAFLLMSTIIGIISFHFLLSTVRAGEDIWTPIGLYGVKIIGLAIDPANSQTIYATTSNGASSVYKSVDGGITWLSSSNGIPDYASASWNDSLAFEPENSDTLYIATEQGVYKSINAGQTWTQKSTLVEDDTEKLIQAWSIAVSPVDGTLFVGGYDGGGENVAGGGIFRSSDGGETWNRLGNGASTGNIGYLAIAPSASNILYAGGYSEVGIFKSLDGGDSWQPINSGFVVNPDGLHIAVDPYDAQVVYFSAHGQGIYKTIDGGQHWTPIGTGLDNSDIRVIAIDPNNQQIIYAGGGPDTGTPGVYRSLDNMGSTWGPIMEGMGSRAIWSLAIDQNNPQNIYAGTASGVWKYTLLSEPVGYSISINDSALFTNQTAITLTLTAPSGTTEMIISNDGSFSGATWEPFVTQKPWAITEYGDYVIPRVVYAKFKTYGQISGVYQDDIILDTIAPTGTVEITDTIGSMINTGFSNPVTILSTVTDTLTNTIYLPITVKSPRLGFSLVGLALSATDDLSGVSEMLISNDMLFTDAQWETYATRKDWWVTETGTTIVYVKFRDRAGNMSTIFSDTVNP